MIPFLEQPLMDNEFQPCAGYKAPLNFDRLIMDGENSTIIISFPMLGWDLANYFIFVIHF